MKTLVVAAAAVLGLAACSPPPLEPVPIGSAPTAGLEGHTAYEVAMANGGLSVPLEYHAIVLPKPSADTLTLGVIPWHAYRYHEKKHSLKDLQGANITDLMAFQARYREGAAARYTGLCAPTSQFVLGKSSMGALTRGTKFGLFREGCKWALVVLPNPAQTGKRLL